MPDIDLDPESHPVYKTWLSVLEKKQSSGYDGLSAAERAFYGVYRLDLEVYNGGFLQYFGNTEGEYARDLVDSLVSIGANETAARVEQFFRGVFPGGVPEDADARRDLALRVEADYEQFEAEETALTDWYLQDADKIFDRLQTYAGEHGFFIE